MFPEQVRAAAREHRYPLLFATVSGAHLYGFPSLDSDWDLRGVHVLPARVTVGPRSGTYTAPSGVHVLPARVTVGLLPTEETVQATTYEGIEVDLVTHDLRKFLTLLLRPNGYVLEQLLSPLVVHTTPEHAELTELAPACLTRRHAYHYIGFAENQWRLFRKEDPPRVKPLLYLFRVLLTGIHLMRTGGVEADLRTLNEQSRLPYIADLLALKIGGRERETLPGESLAFWEGEFHALRAQLTDAMEASSLPEAPTAGPALNDLLVRVRLETDRFR